MGGIVMIALIMILIIFIVICFIINICKESNEERGYRVMTCFFAITASILLGMILNAITTPTIEEYIQGKVKIEIQQIYENGEVVRCDTNYYKL